MNPLWIVYICLCVLMAAATFFSFSELLRPYSKQYRIRLIVLLLIAQGFNNYRNSTYYDPLSACGAACGITAAALSLPLLYLLYRSHTILKNGIAVRASAPRILLNPQKKGRCTLRYSLNHHIIAIPDYRVSMLENGGSETTIRVSRENPYIYTSNALARRARILFFATLPISLGLLSVMVYVVLRHSVPPALE